MNKKTLGYLVIALIALVIISACGNKADEGASDSPANTGTEAPATNQASDDAGNAQQSEAPQNGESAEPSGQPAASDGNAGTAQPGAPASDDASGDASGDILIIIDQTEKPIEGNSFDFVVNKIPEGYMLSKMEWKSDKTEIVNTTQEAIQHGGNGEDGFYISGDGQFSGFIYPDDMKGEEGKVTFTFANEQGKELTWAKKITLK